jgi:hypothetical protein
MVDIDIPAARLTPDRSGLWKIHPEGATLVSKLTDDDFAKINGERDKLVGRIQERYGYAKEQAEREVDDWERASR